MSEELVRRDDPWRGAPDPGARDVLAGMVRVAAGALVRTAAWSYMLDEEGSIPLVGGRPWFGSWDRDVESLRLAEDRLKYLHPMLLAISAWNENAAVFCDRFLPPYFQLKLRPGCLPTIGRHPQRNLAS